MSDGSELINPGDMLREYVRAGKLLELSTVDSDGFPRVVPVWYAPTPSLDLVFTSNVARLHSAHIRSGSKVGGGIIAIELEGLGQVVSGVSLIGTAIECTAAQVTEAYDTYAARWPKAHVLFPRQEVIDQTSKMRMYQIIPSEYTLFDEEHFPEAPKQVLHEWR